MDMTIHYGVNPWSPQATHGEGLNEEHVCCFLYFGQVFMLGELSSETNTQESSHKK